MQLVLYLVTLSAMSFAARNGNVRYVDALNSEKWAGSDAFAWINAAQADLPSTGGIVDARSLGSNSFTVTTQLVIGASGKIVQLLIDPSTTFNISTTGGIDAIIEADASHLDCVSGGLPNSAPYYGGFKLTNSAKVRSMIAPASRTGSQDMFLLSGCNFLGNSAASVSSALIDIQGVFSNSRIRDSNIWNCYTICLLVQPGTSELRIASDISFENVQANGGNVSGSRPCVIKNTLGREATVASIAFFGGQCQHAGRGQYELEINGNGLSSGATTMQFYGLHIETSTGSRGVKILDARNVLFSGFNSSGTGVGSVFNISESASGNTQNIRVESAYNSSRSETNWVSNSAAGGLTIPISIGLGEFRFKTPNSIQSVRGTAGCTTQAGTGGLCATGVSVRWPVAFTDTNYSVSCSPSGTAMNHPSAPYVASKEAGSISFNYYSITGGPASWATVDCLAVHD
jgi:hypothetical protein